MAQSRLASRYETEWARSVPGVGVRLSGLTVTRAASVLLTISSATASDGGETAVGMQRWAACHLATLRLQPTH